MKEKFKYIIILERTPISRNPISKKKPVMNEQIFAYRNKSLLFRKIINSSLIEKAIVYGGGSHLGKIIKHNACVEALNKCFSIISGAYKDRKRGESLQAINYLEGGGGGNSEYSFSPPSHTNPLLTGTIWSCSCFHNVKTYNKWIFLQL